MAGLCAIAPAILGASRHEDTIRIGLSMEAARFIELRPVVVESLFEIQKQASTAAATRLESFDRMMSGHSALELQTAPQPLTPARSTALPAADTCSGCGETAAQDCGGVQVHSVRGSPLASFLSSLLPHLPDKDDAGVCAA